MQIILFRTRDLGEHFFINWLQIFFLDFGLGGWGVGGGGGGRKKKSEIYQLMKKNNNKLQNSTKIFLGSMQIQIGTNIYLLIFFGSA